MTNMSHLWQTDYEVPYWLAAVIFLAFFGTLAVGLVVGNLAGLVAIWAGVLRLALGLFVIYLLYRFVVAVETIAEKH